MINANKQLSTIKATITRLSQGVETISTTRPMVKAMTADKLPRVPRIPGNFAELIGRRHHGKGFRTFLS
jgi:hypothetical protein